MNSLNVLNQISSCAEALLAMHTQEVFFPHVNSTYVYFKGLFALGGIGALFACIHLCWEMSPLYVHPNVIRRGSTVVTEMALELIFLFSMHMFHMYFEMRALIERLGTFRTLFISHIFMDIILMYLEISFL